MYARNAVPLRMIGSWKYVNEGSRSRQRNETNIANESSKAEEEGIEIEVEAMSKFSALAQDPERRHSYETCSVDRYCQVGLGRGRISRTLATEVWNPLG